MSARIVLVLALAACGRIGFGEAGDDGGGRVDGDLVRCPSTSAPLAPGASQLITGPSGSGNVVLWREANGTVAGAHVDADQTLTVFGSSLAGTWVRPVGIEPIASGFAVSLDDGTTEQLFATDATLGNSVARGTGQSGITRAPFATFGDYVMWAHANVGAPTELLIDRLDGMGVPTSHSNYTAPAPLVTLAIDEAAGFHAHLVWAQSDGACNAGEVFAQVAGVDVIPLALDCIDPRGATGIGDSLVSAYRTVTGELRLFVFDDRHADLLLWPGGTQPSVGDDGDSTIWVAWLEATTGPRTIMIARIAADLTVSIRRLEGVTPADDTGFVLARKAPEPRLMVIEDGALTVVQPCL